MNGGTSEENRYLVHPINITARQDETRTTSVVYHQASFDLPFASEPWPSPSD